MDETLRCFQKVYGQLDGTSRWKGFRPCKGKVVGRVVREDGTKGVCFCSKHEVDVQALKKEAVGRS